MTTQTIVYFGDSLTDNGNLFDFGEGVLPDEIRVAISGPTNAVSDGPTHAAYTTEILGATELNYAVASADALGSYTLRDLVLESGLQNDLLVPITDPALDIDINFGAQLDRFFADSAGDDLSHTTAFIFIGGNDYNALNFSSPTVIQDALALTDLIIAAQIEAARDLFDAGTSSVWLSEAPLYDFFVQSLDASAIEKTAFGLLLDTFNASLTQGVAELVADGFDANIATTDAVAEAIAEDPTGFGLLAPYGDTILLSNATDTFDADQIAFYDTIHPSTATHGVLGAYYAHILDGGETETGDEAGNSLSLATTPGETKVVFTYAGADDVLGTGEGRLIAFGGSGDDELIGARGNDLLSGGADNDTLLGRAGDDVISVGLGDDVAKGMRGFDILIDSLGDDMLRGGRDDDIFVFTDASLLGGTDNGTNVFVGGEGFDTLYLVVEDVPSGTVAEDLAADLGLRLRSIEDIVVVDGRDGLTDFAGDPTYDEANVWGLI